MPEFNFLLPLLMVLPILSAVTITFWPAGRTAEIRRFALVGALLVFALGCLIGLAFDPAASGSMQMQGRATWIEPFGLTFGFGLDAISLWLMLLTVFLMPLVIAGSFTAVTSRVREFYFWLLILEAAMIGTFLATDLFFFYICFEFTLVPLFFLIGIFGSGEREKAARVFFLYTFTGSMITFAGLLYVAWFHAAETGTWSFAIAELYTTAGAMSPAEQAWVLTALLAGFAVKVPLFPFHTWLPLAHTEAPTAGSVVLAGVLLKLGTYGLLRFALPLAPDAVVAFAPWIGTLAVIGILYTALICWVQTDIKKLIAYSSVSHLGFCVLGLFALEDAMGPTGAVLYMVNHGLSTGALFLCVGMIYERYHTRELAAYGGLARTMPLWSSFMVFFALASVGLPGLNGFVGEFLTLLAAFQSPATLGPAFAVCAGFGMIFTAIYLLRMLGRIVWGPDRRPERHADGRVLPEDLSAREIGVLAPLALACLFFGFYPRPILSTVEAPVTALIAPYTDGREPPGPEPYDGDSGRDFVRQPPAEPVSGTADADADASVPAPGRFPHRPLARHDWPENRP